MTHPRIKVTDKLAMKILQTVGDRHHQTQSHEWLRLFWQTLNELQKTQLVKKYLAHTRDRKDENTL
jgi:hypothetical protein|tara:strand:+ start:220 stop:417 length:198 start_codon:yes stop_codon:yes gene_type:complete